MGSRRLGRVAAWGGCVRERRLPQTLTVEQVAAIVAAQSRLRDRFLFALLAGTGMRIGQAPGLRHSDVVSQERRIEIVPREDNASGARGKRGHGGCLSPPSSSGCTPTTCTRSTGIWTATTCS
jgi:integrase